jgi:Domain of unknown function (DUF4190)/zinc-ribbon domain
MPCPNCSYENSPNNRFCVKCGIDLSVPPAPATPSFATGTPNDPAAGPGSPPPPVPGPPAAPSPWGAPPPPPPGQWAAPGQQPPPPPPYAAGPPPGAAPPNPFAPPAAYGPPPGAYAPYPPPYPPSGYQTASTNGLAIASLVLGLVGWMACGIGSIVGIVLGFVARSQIRSAQGRQGGDGLALAGIILGFVAIGLFVLLIVVGQISSSNG